MRQVTPGGTITDTNAPGENVSTIGALVSGATSKATPVDADSLGLSDSAASNVLKKLTWANLKATLKTYFDGLYAAVVTSPSWTAPTLTNSWANLGSGYNPAGYYRNQGLIYLRGVVTGGTVSTTTTGTIFQLPAGYRPATRCIFAVMSNEALGRVDVDTDGNVRAHLGNNAYVSLDGIVFGV